MFDKPRSVPPAGEYKREGLPVSVWLFVAAVIAVAVVFAAFTLPTNPVTPAATDTINQPPAESTGVANTTTVTPTTTSTIEELETFSDGWYRIVKAGEEGQHFEVSKYNIKVEIIVLKDRILVYPNSNPFLPSDKDIRIKINFRKNGTVFRTEIIRPWQQKFFEESPVPQDAEWQPQIIIIRKAPVATPTVHKLD
jgi:hypothetical protein